MTTKHSGGEREKAIELAKGIVDSSVGDDRCTDSYKVAKRLLEEVKANEKSVSQAKSLIDTVKTGALIYGDYEALEEDFTAAREKIAQLEANNNRTHGGPNCVSAVAYQALLKRADKLDRELNAACAKIAELEGEDEETEAKMIRIAREAVAFKAERDSLKSQIEQLQDERDKLVRTVGEHLAVRLERTKERDELQAACAAMREVLVYIHAVVGGLAFSLSDKFGHELGSIYVQSKQALLPDAGKQWLERVGKLGDIFKSLVALVDGEYPHWRQSQSIAVRVDESLAELERP